MIQAVSLIGSGNVATHLGKAFVNNGIAVTHINSRSSQNAHVLADILGATVCTIDELPLNQLAVVCVSDDAIQAVMKEIPVETPVVYTSGSIGISDLPKREKLGVFYPLQTFSKSSEVGIQTVPFLLESENLSFLDSLEALAKRFSASVHIVNSEQRWKIHMAAVWINNFTNHIVHQAQKITQEQNLDYQLLIPLLQETLKKLDSEPALTAQTGPARRGDHTTIQKHLNAQTGISKEVYEILSKSIIDTYKNEKL